MIDKKREVIQQEAVEAALSKTDDNGRVRATIQAITGIGKTFIALNLIEKLQPTSVLFLAETTMREADIMSDVIAYSKLYNYDIASHHTITFACYQSAYKWKHTYYDMVVADEILSVPIKLTGISLESILPNYHSDVDNGQSNQLSMVKKNRIGQSAAKQLAQVEGSETISVRESRVIYKNNSKKWESNTINCIYFSFYYMKHSL